MKQIRQIKQKGIMLENGFTMIELVIVIAIMGVLSSVLIPSFSDIIQKARLKADIATIRQVQTQIDIYMAEKDGKYPGGTDLEDNAVLPSEAVAALVKDGYIKASDTKDEATIKLEIDDAETIYKKAGTHLVLDISKAVDKIKESAETLNEKDAEWIYVKEE